VVSASEIAAVRLVVVDTIDDDAARFYAHHRFNGILTVSCRR
jgi:hypothetical protein